jgi:hypothetical protein
MKYLRANKENIDLTFGTNKECEEVDQEINQETHPISEYIFNTILYYFILINYYLIL